MSVSSRNLSQPPHSSPSHDGYKFSVATNSPSKQKQASAVREWDKQSPLSDKQNQVLLAMHTLLSNKQTGKQNEQKAQKEAEVEIENMEQFYSWYNAIDEEYVEEEKYKDRINILNEYKDYCESILTQIKAALDLLRELSDKYLLVSKKTGELHQACESLVLQQKDLVSLAEMMEKKLEHFNQLPVITQKFNTPAFSVHDSTFKALLLNLDECIEFITKNRDFRESESFLLKYRQLQNRALNLIKQEIVQSLRATTAAILLHLKQQGTAVDSVLTETQFYVKFRTLSPKLRPLCQEIEKRATIKEYAVLLGDCHVTYFQQRKQLLQGVVAASIQSLSAQSNDLCSIMRSGCMYLINLSNNEYQLFHHFFATQSTGLLMLLEEVSSSLYATLRPMYIRTHNIELLCQLVYLLRTEIISDHLEQRGKSVEAFTPIVLRMLQDIQERLTFLAQSFIRAMIAAYEPEPLDLNYPQRLLGSTGEEEELKDGESMMPFKSVGKGWYITLERTLVCLSKLYLKLDTKVFEGMATEAVEGCTNSLLRAATSIAAKSPLDAKLFLIKHLLILGEQITPFDINFSIVESTLDFSHMTEALKKMYAVPRSLFAFSTENPLLVAFNPHIESYTLESKKNLERELKSAIESFILAVTKTTVEPLLSFLTKTTAFLSVTAKDNHNNSPLSAQPFAAPEKVNEMMSEVIKGFEEKLPEMLSKMKVYIANAHTQLILTKPIKEQLSESISQLQQLIDAHYSNEKEKLNTALIDKMYNLLETI